LHKVDDILKLLEDGRWHDLNEIGKKIQLRDLGVKSVTQFLARYNFIELDKGGQKAKIGPSTQDFLRKIRQMEGGEGH